jgi:hypothetical protein
MRQCIVFILSFANHSRCPVSRRTAIGWDTKSTISVPGVPNVPWHARYVRYVFQKIYNHSRCPVSRRTATGWAIDYFYFSIVVWTIFVCVYYRATSIRSRIKAELNINIRTHIFIIKLFGFWAYSDFCVSIISRIRFLGYIFLNMYETERKVVIQIIAAIDLLWYIRWPLTIFNNNKTTNMAHKEK